MAGTDTCVVDAPPVDATKPTSSAHERVAVFVCHGMGQQVRFETIDVVARLIATGAEARLKAEVSEITTRVVLLPGLKTTRAELTIDAGERPRDVHVYEAYWAPLTEGAVTLRDALRFLFGGAWNGVWGLGWARRFDRFIFNAARTFVIPWRNIAALVAASAVAALLVSLTGGVLFAVTKRFAARGADAEFWNRVLLDWTIDLVLFVVPLTVLAAAFVGRALTARRRRRAALRPGARHANRSFRGRVQRAALEPGPARTDWAIWALIALSALGLAAANACGAGHLWLESGRPLAAGTGVLRSLVSWQFPALARAAVWVLAIALSYGLRWFLIQFAGDVAAYVSGPWLDRFFKLREEIQTTCWQVARAIYQCPDYQRVIVVGHSLGSVIAYDTLNALINEDLLGVTPGVIARTSALITFGSPLDKTAFIFRTHTEHGQIVREGLAAAVQPMVTAYDYRPPLWVNIWSPNDVISGRLDFYDVPGEPPPGHDRRIRNVIDPDADVPLVAHVQYWGNPLLAAWLTEALDAPRAVAKHGA